MAEGGYDHLPEWYDDNTGEYPDNDDDYNADETTPFFPNGASTPYQAHAQEEMEMKTFQKKSDRPGPSYVETSFGGTEDLERRLAILRRDSETGMLNTTKIPKAENPLNFEEREKEIQRVRDFIKKRYPNADLSKLVIRFSSSSKKTDGYCCFGCKGRRNQDNQR